MSTAQASREGGVTAEDKIMEIIKNRGGALNGAGLQGAFYGSRTSDSISGEKFRETLDSLVMRGKLKIYALQDAHLSDAAGLAYHMYELPD